MENEKLSRTVIALATARIGKPAAKAALASHRLPSGGWPVLASRRRLDSICRGTWRGHVVVNAGEALCVMHDNRVHLDPKIHIL